MVLTIIVLSRIARRFEKRTLFNFGCILSMLCYLGYFFIPGKFFLITLIIIFLFLSPNKCTIVIRLGVDATDPLVLRYGVFLMSGFIGIGHVRVALYLSIQIDIYAYLFAGANVHSSGFNDGRCNRSRLGEVRGTT